MDVILTKAMFWLGCAVAALSALGLLAALVLFIIDACVITWIKREYRVRDLKLRETRFNCAIKEALYYRGILERVSWMLRSTPYLHHLGDPEHPSDHIEQTVSELIRQVAEKEGLRVSQKKQAVDSTGGSAPGPRPNGVG